VLHITIFTLNQIHKHNILIYWWYARRRRRCAARRATSGSAQSSELARNQSKTTQDDQGARNEQSDNCENLVWIVGQACAMRLKQACQNTSRSEYFG